MKKKAKNIHLSEQAIKAISIQAIKEGTNFKNYVEQKLENLAVQLANNSENEITEKKRRKE
jgi:predicted DNA binding CopG/RHH family protein